MGLICVWFIISWCLALRMKCSGSPGWVRHRLGQKAQGLLKMKKMVGDKRSQCSTPEKLFSCYMSFCAQERLCRGQRLEMEFTVYECRSCGFCRTFDTSQRDKILQSTSSCFVHLLIRTSKTQQNCCLYLKPGLKVEQTLKCTAWIVYLGPKPEFQPDFVLADMCQCKWLAQGLFCNFKFVLVSLK